jgi:hypothetical protein
LPSLMQSVITDVVITGEVITDVVITDVVCPSRRDRSHH